MKTQQVNVDCNDCEVRDSSVFAEIHATELNVINTGKHCNHYQKGDIIFSEGNYPSSLYCIHHGKIKLQKLGSDGREQIIRLVKAGEVLGYRALLSGEQFYSSAVAIDECIVCVIPKESFFELVRSNARLAFNMMELLSTELRHAQMKVVEMAQKSVKERLAEGLLILHHTYGLQNDKKTLAVMLSREELATMIGTATETVIRLLAEFKRLKYVDFRGRNIAILNYNALLKTANVDD
jgi:CRP-like cAMP-binding protein